MIGRRSQSAWSWSLALVALASGVARADVSAENAARASQLFEQGRKDLAARRVDAACDAFAASFGLDPQPGTRLNLGVCRVQQNKLLDAYALFEDALNEAESTGRATRVAFARDQLRALDGKLVRIHFVLTNASGATLMLNGVAADPAKRQLSRPGKIVVEVTAPDRKPYHVEKIVDAGAELTIDVPALEPVEPDRPVLPPEKLEPQKTETEAVTAAKEPIAAPRSRGKLPYVAGGVGGALWIGAGALTLHARSRWSTAIDNNDAGGVTSAQHEADIATAMAIGGAIAVGVGVVLWVRGGSTDRDRVTVSASPGGVVMKGSF